MINPETGLPGLLSPRTKEVYDMHSMKDLFAMMEEHPELKENYDRHIDSAREMASKIPLVRAMRYVPPVGKLLEFSYPLKVSDEASSRAITIKCENNCNLGRNLYFYVGRSYPVFGGATYAFNPEISNGHTGSASPFDSGEAYECLCKLIPPERAAVYIADEKIPLDEWQQEFANYLAAFFPSLDSYWFGGPCELRLEMFQVSPEKVLDHWQLWAFEVRFHEGQELFSAIRWSASEGYMADFQTAVVDIPPIYSQLLNAVDAFLDRHEPLNDDKDHALTIESWVRRTVGLEL